MERAKRWYGERPEARRAYQVCTRGLVALSKIKGSPIENVSNPKMRQAGSTSTCERQKLCGAMGSQKRLTSSSTKCSADWRFGERRRVVASA